MLALGIGRVQIIPVVFAILEIWATWWRSGKMFFGRLWGSFLILL
jgi:hypothetical protein